MVTYYLDVEGVKGDVQTAPYVRWIAVSSYSFSHEKRGVTGIQCTARPFEGMNKLFLLVADGREVAYATLLASKDPAPYLRIGLHKVYVSSMSVPGDPSADFSFSLDAGTMDWVQLPDKVKKG